MPEAALLRAPFPRPVARPRVIIATPLSWEYLPRDFKLSMDSLRTWEGCEKTTQDGGACIADMRNNAVWQAFERHAEAILFVDADMVFPSDALGRIVAHQQPIVSGHCLRRRRPFEPTTAIEGADGKLSTIRLQGKGLVPVDAVGAAFLYVSIEVFRKVPSPWFEHGRLSEDYDFCEKARRAGFPIFVDLGLRIGHLAQAVVMPGEDGEPVLMMR